MIAIGIGSNLGNSLSIIERVMLCLERLAQAESFLSSSIWVTSPVNCPPGSPNFLNAVVLFELQNAITPLELMVELQLLERKFGRSKTDVVNAPRLIDLDLLLFEGMAQRWPGLEVPHPRGHRRLFVLKPLQELVPGLIWPGIGKSVSQLINEMDTNETIEKLRMES